MLAVLLLNRMSMKRHEARKQMLSQSLEEELNVPEVSMCRTCLSTDDLQCIFVNKECEKKRSNDLKLVTGLEIKMDDGLSQNICRKCINKMNTALQFRRTSKKAEKTLLSMVSSKKAKKKCKIRKKTIKSTPNEDICNSDVDFGEDFQNDNFGMDGGDDYQDDEYPHEVPLLDETYGTVKQEVIEPTKAALKRKRQVIPNAPSYKCATCNKEFRMKATYKAHMRFHTNYCVCEACGKRCRNNNQLQEHKRARHGLGRIHKCAYCEYSAATKEALTIHERRHTGERPYVCDHCGATFHRRSNLVQHIAIHLPEKNFQCDMCPKRLKSRKFLQIHKHNAHTGKRYGYLCAVCDHRFEKPNKCNLCHQREKSKKRLQVHKYKMHREKRYKYVCPVCRDVFSRPGNVRQHLTRSHAVPRERQVASIERFEVDTSILPEIIGNTKVFNFGNT